MHLERSGSHLGTIWEAFGNLFGGHLGSIQTTFDGSGAEEPSAKQIFAYCYTFQLKCPKQLQMLLSRCVLKIGITEHSTLQAKMIPCGAGPPDLTRLL